MDKHEGFFVATFTAFLVLATAFLWRSTNALWKATKTAAEKQSLDTQIIQRAYLTARIGGIDIGTNGQVIGQVTIVNTGHLPDGLFDVVIGPYDFAILCTVTERVLSKGAATDVGKRVSGYFNRCRTLNQEARIVVAHGSWTLDGARHVSRNKLKADIHFEKPDDLRKQASEARKLMRELFSLGATHGQANRSAKPTASGGA